MSACVFATSPPPLLSLCCAGNVGSSRYLKPDHDHLLPADFDPSAMPVSRSAALQPASFPKELERSLVEVLCRCGSKGKERVVDAFSAKHAGPSKRQVRLVAVVVVAVVCCCG